MNKISIILAISAILLSIFSIFYFQNDSQLVYVDVNKLMDGYKRTAIEQSKFEAKATALQSNVDSLISNWQEELKTYEKERSTMTNKELELKQELLSNKQQQIGSYQQAIQKQIQEEEQKASQTIFNDVNDYIKEFGKKNNYKIIFGASGSGNIMYADEGADLTEEVLSGLNKEYQGN
jgi:outer membrane protein